MAEFVKSAVLDETVANLSLIRLSTTTASDTGEIRLQPYDGTSINNARGAHFTVYGANHASQPGVISGYGTGMTITTLNNAIINTSGTMTLTGGAAANLNSSGVVTINGVGATINSGSGNFVANAGYTGPAGVIFALTASSGRVDLIGNDVFNIQTSANHLLSANFTPSAAFGATSGGQLNISATTGNHYWWSKGLLQFTSNYGPTSGSAYNLNGSINRHEWYTPNLTMTLTNAQFACVPMYTNTTAGAANVNVIASGLTARSTSSLKYKTAVEDMEESRARNILNARPIWYRSTASADDPDLSWYGFGAEELALIDPRFVIWDYEPEDMIPHYQKNKEMPSALKPRHDAKKVPIGVDYGRISVALVKILQNALPRINQRLSQLEKLNQTDISKR